MLKRWYIYLTTLLGCMALYLAHQQWLSWLVLVAVVLAPLFSLIISLPAMLTARVSIRNRGGMPQWTNAPLEMELHCPLPAPPYRLRAVVRHNFSDETDRLENGDSLPTGHCGCLEILPKKCRVYDYLGLFSIKIRRPERSTLLLWPRKATLEVPKTLERHISQSWKPKPGGGYAENHELRLYRPGDNLNQVHWKLSAKMNDYIVREAMEPARGKILLTMDIKGTASTVDRSFSHLQFYGKLLLGYGMAFDLHALTGTGRLHFSVRTDRDLRLSISALLRQSPAQEGTIRGIPVYATWHHHIGEDD